MNRLQGKVALITGAAKGIGQACAIRMAEEGCRVAITDVLDEAGQSFEKDLRQRGFDAHYFHCNVADEKQVSTTMDKVITTFERLDILVNNAGIAGVNKPTHEVTEAEWDQVQAVNVKGVFFCTKHAIPHLKKSGGAALLIFRRFMV